MSHPNPVIQQDIQTIIESGAFWEHFDNSHILVTGASGFMASYIVETLLELNEKSIANMEIYALGRNKSKFWKKFSHHKNNKHLHFLHFNVVEDLSSLTSINLTHIIHAASNASPKYYGVDPVGTLDANTLGTRRLLALARDSNVKSFVFISSAEIYGQANTIPTGENDYGYLDPMRVRSCYAESKRMGENMCVSWAHQYGVAVRIIRPFHTYGPGMDLDDGRVYADFVKNIVKKEPLMLNSDGTAKRAFCYLSDAVSGIFFILNKGKNNEAYNLGNDQCEISIKNLALELQDLYPERSSEIVINTSKNRTSGNRVSFDNSNYIASQVERICPNIEKLKTLGWSPNIGIEEGFRRTVESYIYES